MRRTAFFIYGILCYSLFFAVFLYSVGFIGNFLTPTALDAAPRLPFGQANLVNGLLLLAFALQHSGMARPTFKRWWTQFVPRPIERSTYVLFSNLAMILLFVFWQPLGGTVWEVHAPWGRAALYSLFGLGWAVVFFTTCLLNHFELFGLRQVWLYFTNQPYTALPFREPSLYRWVRHPLYVGWLMACWFTPTMTMSHLLFAIGITVYILAAIQLEERNLVEALPGYEDYRRRVPMLLPIQRAGRQQETLTQHSN